MKYCILGRKTDATCNSLQFCSYSYIVNTPIAEWIASWIVAFLDSFCWRSQYHKHSYSGGGDGSHKVVGKGYIKTENSWVVSIGAIFAFHISHKAAKSMSNSSAGCLLVKGRWSHLKIDGKNYVLPFCVWKLAFFQIQSHTLYAF